MDISISPRLRNLGPLGLAILMSGVAVAVESEPIPEPTKKSASAESSADRERQELLDRILTNVAKARDTLGETATRTEAPPLQRQVVTDLETLIEMLKQNQQSPPPPQGGASGSKPESPSSDTQSKPSAQQQSSSEDSESEGEKSRSQADSQNGQNRDDAEDSQERQGSAREAERRARRQQRLESDIWGHLPPKLRDQLLNTYGERMLPQYEEFVRKFYDALSEPTRAPKSR
jgi:hypothetical protein